MSTCAVVRSFIESKTTEVQTSSVGFTSEVSDYLVVHTGPGGAEEDSHFHAGNWPLYLEYDKDKYAEDVVTYIFIIKLPETCPPC